ncbi:glycoside hydrolase family 3 [Fusarium vanettenii 77-13-4]|uniref:beta-glucosidase n=1 Tax=Fusarium vanettenii (strain ATCC MYA-4622 / CBS 123669 / FGSC 9596 / NRRL 45880 / 77-13-4) TaxID=660122 RepID=C7ZQ56_FUSV7|nr:glycoside hydrolase family 3 [Fusarium vanettenii 77-13-4]EEU33850.1 glycoside hydrolase family 3 [Fusarium vanettenii 77-13-4]
MANIGMDRSFLTVSVEELVSHLSVTEKVAFIAGEDWWRTVALPRLNIPSVKLTDRPNGARGQSFFKMTPAVVLPNATGLAATFSPTLPTEAARLLASETKARNAVCLLAPTVNICRSPLGGRAFESFSEDPTLSGIIAAEYIKGLQDEGISAAIKHFVANDQEHERMGQDSIIAPRALREIYLRPFQIAQARAGPWAYMTSYNKLNGTHCSENEWLLKDVLRDEWGFDGLVMSDWMGTYSVAEAINAGLDLEMPGKPRWRQPQLVRQSINSHKIRPETLDERVITLLRWVQKLAILNPDMVYDSDDFVEWTRKDDQEVDAALVRRIGSEGIVLLKNEASAVITGGGSARLRPAWSVTPWQGLIGNKPNDVELSYALGCKGSKFLPVFGEEFTSMDGVTQGFDMLHYAIVNGKQASKPACSEVWKNSDIMLADFTHPDLGDDYFTEIRAMFTAPITGDWEFEVSVTGQAWVYLDGELVADLSKEQKRTSSFFGNGGNGTIITVSVTKGQVYTFRLLHDSRKPPLAPGQDSQPLQLIGMKLGSFPAIDEDQTIDEAVELAKSSDFAVLVVGLDQDWESESYDRPNLSLPLRLNDLVRRVATEASRTKTAVVLQTGSAVSMPWLGDIDSVLWPWYGGNEAGNAIADIVYGKVNPSGRLPITLPKRELDIAANLNFRSARTRTYYEEGIWVGYRHFNARGIEPMYPFGHGLSYTDFEYSQMAITPSKSTSPSSWRIKVSVKVTNTGDVAGAHSVHFYTSPPPPTSNSLTHPEVTLQAFTKTGVLLPGKSETVTVEMDKYAVSHWDELSSLWRAEPGQWYVKIGKNAQDMCLEDPFTVDAGFNWKGI